MLKVAVAGASGYMGAELLRLLTVHPKVEFAAVTSERLSGERLDHIFPHLRGLSDLTFQELDAARLVEQADVVFLALPHMESQRAVPVLRGHGRKVIDLSADYRLRDAIALHHVVQGRARRRRGAQGGGVRDARAAPKGDRGLPRWSPRRAATPWARCSPSRHSLARGWGGPDGIVIDGKSGVTGAGAQGRKVDAMYLYTEANENVQAYGLASHRHTPEIEQELSGARRARRSW